MLSIYLLTLLIAVPLFSHHWFTPNFFNRLTVITLIWAGWLSLDSIFFEPSGLGQAIFSGNFYVSTLTCVFDAFLCFVGATALGGWAYFENSKIENFQFKNSTKINSIFSLLVIFSMIGGCMLISSANFLSIFVALELQSLAVYVLAGLYKDSFTATGASLKYFFLGAFSTALILLGVALVYSATGNFSFESIAMLCNTSGNFEIFNELNLGFFMVTIGLLFKIAAAPFHNWAPDVYDGTPTVVTLWISSMPKISIFIFLLNFAFVAPMNGPWFFLVLISSLFSLIVGAVLGQTQNRVKRLLAFSTISHVGFMLLGLSTANFVGVESVIFYLMSYSVTNVLVFLVVLAISHEKIQNFGHDIELLGDFKGIFWSMPLLSISLATCLFSIAGVPPIIGFVAKAKILQSTLGSSYAFMTLVAVVVSVISAVYYLKFIRTIFFYKNGQSATLEISNFSKNFESSSVSKISNFHSVLIAIITLVLALVLIHPNFLLNTASLLAANFY